MAIMRAMILAYPNDTSSPTMNQYMLAERFWWQPVDTAVAQAVGIPAGRELDRYKTKATITPGGAKA